MQIASRAAHLPYRSAPLQRREQNLGRRGLPKFNLQIMVRTRFLSCVASTESDSFRGSLPLQGTNESAQTFATHAHENLMQATHVLRLWSGLAGWISSPQLEKFPRPRQPVRQRGSEGTSNSAILPPRTACPSCFIRLQTRNSTRAERACDPCCCEPWKWDRVPIPGSSGVTPPAQEPESEGTCLIIGPALGPRVLVHSRLRHGMILGSTHLGRLLLYY